MNEWVEIATFFGSIYTILTIGFLIFLKRPRFIQYVRNKIITIYPIYWNYFF